MPTKYETAINAGFSHDDIIKFLQPKIDTALSSGFSQQEINGFLGLPEQQPVTQPTTQQATQQLPLADEPQLQQVDFTQPPDSSRTTLQDTEVPQQLQDVGRIANIPEQAQEITPELHTPVQNWIYPFERLASSFERAAFGIGGALPEVAKAGVGVLGGGTKLHEWLTNFTEFYEHPEKHGLITPRASKKQAERRLMAYQAGTAMGITNDIVEAGVDLTGLLLQLKLTGKIAPKTSPLFQSNKLKQMSRHAGRVGVHRLLTDNGEVQDRIQSAITMIGFNITPYIASSAGLSTIPSVAMDSMLNMILSSPNYLRAMKQDIKKNGQLTDEFWSAVIPDIVMNIGMAMQTRGDPQKIRNRKINKFAKAKGMKFNEAEKVIRGLQNILEKEELDLPKQQTPEELFKEAGGKGEEKIQQPTKVEEPKAVEVVKEEVKEKPAPVEKKALVTPEKVEIESKQLETEKVAETEDLTPSKTKEQLVDTWTKNNKRLRAMAKGLGFDDKELHEKVELIVNKKSIRNLTEKNFDKIFDVLKPQQKQVVETKALDTKKETAKQEIKVESERVKKRGERAVLKTVDVLRKTGHINIDLVTQAMTGKRGSVIEKVIYDDIRTGRKKSHSIKQDVSESINKNAPKEMDKFFIGHHTYSKPVKIKLESGELFEMTRGDLLTLKIYSKNKKAFNALLGGGVRLSDGKLHKIVTNDIEKIKLSKAEQDAVDAGFNAIETKLFPEVNKTYKEIHGRELKKEEFYLKILRDDIDFDTKQIPMQFLKKNIETPSITKERTGSIRPLLVTDYFQLMRRIIREGSDFAGLAKPITDAKLFLDAGMKQAIVEAYDKSTLRSIQAYLEDIQGTAQKGAVDRFVTSRVSKLAKGTLGFKVFTVARQPISVLLSSAYKSDPRLKKSGLFKTLANPKKWGNTKEMEDNSAQLWFRKQGHTDIAVGEAFEGEKMSKVSRAGMKMIVEADWKAIQVIWGWTKSSLEKSGLKGQELLDETARITEDIVDKTQPSFEPETRPEIARAGGVARLYTMFMSGRNKTMQLYVRNLLDYEQSAKTPKDRANLAYSAVMIAVVIPLMHTAIDEARKAVLKKKGKPSDANDIMASVVKKNLENLYGGQIPSYIIDQVRGQWGFEPNNPLNTALTQGADATVGITKGISEEDLLKTLKGVDQLMIAFDKTVTGVGYAGMRELVKIPIMQLSGDTKTTRPASSRTTGKRKASNRK